MPNVVLATNSMQHLLQIQIEVDAMSQCLRARANKLRETQPAKIAD
jgi:hypothetical protein